MHETMLSVGIDIGTTTTSLVFSRLTIENLASSYSLPRISIVAKDVIYRSKIYFTPLRSADEIDAEAVGGIVLGEYRLAGIKPDQVQTGAVIITGETARKFNASQVLQQLSALAGDFVVATAGPALESVLSARGAGADRLADERRMVVANLDVGGGTTNIALFERTELRGTSCLDIGGRLIKVENGRITYIAPKIAALARRVGPVPQVGDIARQDQLERICRLMAAHLAQALHLLPADADHAALYTGGGAMLPRAPAVGALTFSGGVADSVYADDHQNPYRYGDIGILLGQAIRDTPELRRLEWLTPFETIRATVVGAGTYSTEISGSTISYAEGLLPVKNVPVLKIADSDAAAARTVIDSLRAQLPVHLPEGVAEPVAIAMRGERWISFADIQELASAIIQGAKEVIDGKYPLIIVLEHDIGKALGHALRVQLGNRKDVICIDGIRAENGDYVDIGQPIAMGRVVPVIIKTLVFNT